MVADLFFTPVGGNASPERSNLFCQRLWTSPRAKGAPDVAVLWCGGAMKVAAFFEVGDVVTYGKYQNKRALIKSFQDDGKGNPLVELEPIPKGKKKNKTIALFKIRRVKDDKKTASRVAQRWLEDIPEVG
jgi:hypothetical protein